MSALIDLWFATDSEKKLYRCSLCLKNPVVAKRNKCQEPGFENLKIPKKIESSGESYSFCPGKATWYPEISEVFEQCRVAMDTGIMPKQGSLEDQDEMFFECFPMFVTKWKDRTYQKIWADVQSFTKTVLEAIFPKK
jgi:hypothetical protein